MKKTVFQIITIVMLGLTLSSFTDNNLDNENMKNQEVQDRMEIRALVDRYALESDHYNQEGYREIFVKNLNLRIVAGEKVTEIHGVDEMVRIYKAAGAAKISFHQVGQQVVDFTDETHAKGTTYLTALLGNEKVAQMFIRYEDKFEKIDGRWWITDRDQIIVYSR